MIGLLSGGSLSARQRLVQQIIVAERTGVDIEYVSGSIEDPEIRDLGLNVLEGGEEAFRKRQQKYRLGN
jgi:hypothetical protein